MLDSLPRREREIFELLCQLEQASAVAVREAMADPPSGSAVRTLLSRLEAKGLVRHWTENQTYIYAPAVQSESVVETALRKMMQTFFNGSAASAATALLGMEKSLNAEEIDALQRAIDAAQERSDDN